MIKWGLSPLDWRKHAIDKDRDHPHCVFKAECGHLLMMVTPLEDQAGGQPCEQCARRQGLAQQGV